MPSASLQSALTEYSSSGINVSFGELLRRHIYLVIASGLILAIAAVMFIKRNAERSEKMLKDKLAVQNKQLENEQRAYEINSMISTIAVDYRSVFRVDLEYDEGYCYRTRNRGGNEESDLEGIKMGDKFPFLENFVRYANNFVAEADRENFLKFIEPENIRAKLSKEVMTGHRYLAIKNGVEQYEMIRIVDTHLGQTRDRINLISVGFADVDSETCELMEQNRALSEALKNKQKS